MTGTRAWDLGVAPLRNSLRAVVYTRRGPDHARAIPPVRFLIKAACVAAVCFGVPLATRGVVAGALAARGQPIEALTALGWAALSALSAVFGLVGAIGMSLPRAIGVDELLLALPLESRTYLRAKLLALQVEGLCWTALLAYPIVLQSLAIQAARPSVHLVATAAGVLQSLTMTSLGVAVAHAMFALRPATRRLRLLVRTMMILVAGGGLGVLAVATQSVGGGVLTAALRVARVPLSPIALPMRAVAAAQAGSPGAAVIAFAGLAATTAIAATLALALMRASHARVSFLEDQ